MSRLESPLSRLQDIQEFVRQDSSVAYGYYGADAPVLKYYLFWARLKLALRLYERHAAEMGKTALLDFGCQFGFASAALSREFADVYLVELSPSIIQLGLGIHRRFGQKNAISILNDATDPAAYLRYLKTGSRIDLFLCFDVLEHMPALDAFLGSLRSAGSAKAFMLISLPTENFFYLMLTRFKREPDHIHRYAEIETKLRQQGVTLVARKSLWGLFHIYLYQL